MCNLLGEEFWDNMNNGITCAAFINNQHFTATPSWTKDKPEDPDVINAIIKRNDYRLGTFVKCGGLTHNPISTTECSIFPWASTICYAMRVSYPGTICKALAKLKWRKCPVTLWTRPLLSSVTIDKGEREGDWHYLYDTAEVKRR